ncbi:MAG: hypothetical protein EOO03_06160 [Chitinophagaceae bacterium]|nr:MAG: hypothetical protein EOO03_06160 [Chitinophagaceae bacterium]
MKKIISNILLLVLFSNAIAQTKINRQALVQRHNVHLTKADTLASLSVGNGAFAFAVDVTGLQTFPNEYAKGVPLGTQSEWGWHSFPNVNNIPFEDALKTYQLNGRPVKYAVQWGGGPDNHKKAAEYYRVNQHRLQLANIGFDILKKDGSVATLNDIKNINQTLDMWTGEVSSSFTVEDIPVQVTTYGHQQQDAVAVKVVSDIVAQKRLSIRIRLPYPTGGWEDRGNNFTNDDKHQSSIIHLKNDFASLKHTLDTTTYYANLQWSKNSKIEKKADHYFQIKASSGNTIEFSCLFSPDIAQLNVPKFLATQNNSKKHWQQFWKSGGAIDFSGSTDERANELERRIILSQYLTKVQCAGNNPPQETGLTYNSWYGKPHMEMIWWHAAHYALWGRTDLLEKSMQWYFKARNTAKGIAQRQGYEGVRWQKMTDNDGREVPSSIGSFLIWNQPHFIYFAEQVYRNKKNKSTINKYKELVFETADFMASFARYDSAKQKYVLGKGLIAAQERFKAEVTFNPTYELVYWHWALNVANDWRVRSGLPRNKKWDDVVKELSPLPVQNNKYLFTESATDSYTNPEFRTDHPSVVGALGMMPHTPMMDTNIMQNTFNWIWDNWSWHETWGWDFPMVAMTATRLNDPERAINSLLMNIQTNTYLPNGHNYQEGRLTIYLPGNGGMLIAAAMMVAGYDAATASLPGIPKNNGWKVKWEGLQKMP